MNYKIGDIVRVKNERDCFRINSGELARIKEVDKHDNFYVLEWLGENRNDDSGCFWKEEWLEPAQRELKDVRGGDIITDGNDYRYIFGRVDEAVFVGNNSYRIEDAKVVDCCTYSLPEFLNDFSDYIIYTKPTEEVIELTIDDIAKLKGVDPKLIKIKK